MSRPHRSRRVSIRLWLTSTIDIESQDIWRRVLIVRWACSRHGEKVQMWTGEVGSRGDGLPSPGFRTRCFSASQGAGRSRKTTLAFGEGPLVGLSRRNPSA